MTIVEKKADLIKPLTELVEAESDWKLRLRALKGDECPGCQGV